MHPHLGLGFIWSMRRQSALITQPPYLRAERFQRSNSCIALLHKLLHLHWS